MRQAHRILSGDLWLPARPQPDDLVEVTRSRDGVALQPVGARSEAQLRSKVRIGKAARLDDGLIDIGHRLIQTTHFTHDLGLVGGQPDDGVAGCGATGQGQTFFSHR